MGSTSLLSTADGGGDFSSLRDDVKSKTRLEMTLKQSIVGHPGHCIREIVVGVSIVHGSAIRFEE